MADERPLSDQYDFAAEPEAAPTVVEPEAPQVEPERPRGPDGKFLPAPKVHSPRLTKLAKSLGFTDDEIGQTDSDQLYRDVQLASIEQERSRRETSVREAAQPTPAPVAEPVSEGVIDWGVEEDGVPATEKSYLPRFAQLIRDVHELKQENKTLKAQLGQIGGYVEGQVRQTFAQKIDTQFAKHPEIFGEGTAAEINRESPDFLRRKLLIQQMEATAKEPGTIEQKFAKAFETLFGFSKPVSSPEPSPTPPPQPTPSAQPAMTPERWNAGTLAAPTSRNGAKEPKGVALAKKTFIELESARRAAGTNHDGESADYFD